MGDAGERLLKTLLSTRQGSDAPNLGGFLALGLGGGGCLGGALGRLALRLLHVGGPEGEVLYCE